MTVGNRNLAPHVERVMGEVGQSLTITNRSEDEGTTDSYGDPDVTESTENVTNAIVDLLRGEAINRGVQGAEHSYDARIYVPEDTTVNENDESNQASRVKVDDSGVSYIVEKKDPQPNSMIRLDCNRLRS